MAGLNVDDSAARPVETCWWVKLPRPNKASAVSSNFDDTADPNVSSLDLKKITSPPCPVVDKTQ